MAYPNFPNIDFAYDIPHERVRYNVRYGPHVMQRLNIYKSHTQDNVDGNPVIVFMHGGGWSSNDKTRTVENPGNPQKALFSFLMDPQWTSGGPDGPSVATSAYVVDKGIDVVSIEWRQYLYTQFGFGNSTTRSSIYEEQGVPIVGSESTGNVATTHATFPTNPAEDAQIAVQWVKDNAARYGFNPNKVFLWGTSAGGNGALIAALTPTRRYKPKHLVDHKFDRSSSSDVIGILNWYGQISMSPFYFGPLILGAMFGVSESSDGSTNGQMQGFWRKRRDMERILLLPDASGAYTSASELSPICKAISPSSIISELEWARKSVRIYSTFFEWEDSLAPNSPFKTGYYTYEGLTPNGINSPWYGAGHEWRQLYDLSSVCLAESVSHDGKVVRAPGSIYTGSTITSAEPFNFTGANTLIVSSYFGSATVTFDNGSGKSAIHVASSIVRDCSTIKIGADVLDTSVVIRTTSGTNTQSVYTLFGAANGTAPNQTGSSVWVSIISSPAVTPLALSAGQYRGSNLNPINQVYNPVHTDPNGFFFSAGGAGLEESLERDMPRLYQWIKKTCGFSYVATASGIWNDPIQ